MVGAVGAAPWVIFNNFAPLSHQPPAGHPQEIENPVREVRRFPLLSQVLTRATASLVFATMPGIFKPARRFALVVKTRTMINEKCFTIFDENIKTSTKLALDRRDPGLLRCWQRRHSYRAVRRIGRARTIRAKRPIALYVVDNSTRVQAFAIIILTRPPMLLLPAIRLKESIRSSILLLAEAVAKILATDR
jgi:hypothetical protein